MLGVSLNKAAYNITPFEKLTKYRSILSQIERMGFVIKISGNIIECASGNLRFGLRKDSSDLKVFEQIFLKDEYRPVLDCIHVNKISINTLVDAGSNIGLTSLFFLRNLQSFKLVCIEPDPKNFQQLEANIPAQAQACLIQKALWYEQKDVFLHNDFRDNSDWSAAVSEQKISDVTVQTVTLQNVIDDNAINVIDLLKIDIEGAEAVIFDEANDLSFLHCTKIIAIEIHDEFNCREKIQNILRKYSFVLFETGELTVGINQQLVANA
jgi:FkbM family methyltransferase